MPPIGPTSRRDLIRYLRQLGFTGPHPGTKHQFMDNGTSTVRLPNPHRGDIGRELLLRLLRQAGIDRDTWEGL
ncbi:MAG: type II toxin-antitoxin system HicA family toxin [Chloroflexia bacterium]